MHRLIFLILLISPITLSADSSSQQLQRIKEKVNNEQSIRDYAISSDGRYLLVIRKHSQALELLNSSDFALIKAIPIKGMAKKNEKIDFIFTAISRQSFIVGMGSSNLVWEILYEDNPLPVYNGVMHDYRLGEGLVRDQSHFPIRIIKPAGKTSVPISSYYFYSIDGLLFIARDKIVEVIQLDARQSISKITFESIPNLIASKIKTLKDTPHLFVPFLQKQGVIRINMNSWTAIEVK